MPLRLPLFVLSFLLAGHAIAEGLSFDEARRLADMQPPEAAYAGQWDAFNNTNHLDEKDGCYQKAASTPTEQVLVLDKTGLVTDVIADVENAKSKCFRQSYLNVRFPAPPFAPYYVHLKMMAMY